MKAELKLFIRTVITEQLEKWSDNQVDQNPVPFNSFHNSPAESNALGDDADLLELLDEKKPDENMSRYKTLIRIGIEFCVTIQDCYFLFYDLFLLF